ncbi:SDR family oxidoreductase [Filobacillus milosensis]|uniref:SDR family oxidoreductase n=1 Tax=Filobacillus milosensis TaxID=94137 RepID=A0A4Y8IK75_9BACI|nr:SDR family oxidoreductase [Filobacillus milosensis]TFB21344.1 SDR family oxidoreductase [Filobacillus milosensis]
MKVLVVGANGQIGKQATEMLQESDEHHVRAMVRKEDQLNEFKEKGIEAVLADLEGPVDQLTQAADGCDAVIFAAGSGGKTGADKTLLIDLDGAVKMVEAAEKAGVKRFLMVSALQAHNRENWNEKICHYYVAKHYADIALVQSSLNHTIVRPGGLLNEEGTGKIRVAENLPERATVPREDVARVLVASINEEQTFNRGFDLLSGEESVKEALKKL